jgi:hypothetical protein
MSFLRQDRIAYINFAEYPSRNIEKKISAMAMGAHDAGISNFDFLYINGEKHDMSGSVKYIKYPDFPLRLNYYNFIFRRYPLISRSVDLDKYQYIILRYSGGDATGVHFFSEFSVVSEHHSLELPEFKSKLRADLPIYMRFLKKTRMNLEKKYGSKILGLAKGIIGVTSEITKYEVDRAGGIICSATIPNGITVKQIPETKFKKFNGKDLDLVCLANSFAPWHGIERVMQSMALYKGPVKIKLHVVGTINRMSFSPFHHDIDVQFHGYKAGHELDKLLAQMNLGIGTLSLYNKNMKEACPLKTREYTARGLPFVIAYMDPDLQQVDNNNRFFIEFENDQSMIDMELIVQFADQVSKNKEISTYMRNYALKHMDWSAKMVKYSEFMEKITNL